MRYFGPPDTLWLDAHGSHQSKYFTEHLAADGTTPRLAPGEAHAQQGVVERHGQAFERKLRKLVSSLTPSGREEWEEIVASLVQAKNNLLGHHGYSSSQHIFGKNIRIPGDLLDEQRCVAARSLSQASDALSRCHNIRMAARQALLEEEDDKAFKIATDKVNTSHYDFATGDIVCYWRGGR